MRITVGMWMGRELRVCSGGGHFQGWLGRVAGVRGFTMDRRTGLDRVLGSVDAGWAGVSCG